MRPHSLKLGVFAVAIFSAHLCTAATTSGSIEYGSGNKTDLLRIGSQIKSPWHYPVSPTSKIALFWEFSLAYWRLNRAGNVAGSDSSLVDLGITPAFRWAGTDDLGFFSEAGIGVHGLTKKYNNNGRQLSTNLQFGSHLGIGYVFDRKLSLSVRVEHVSNGGIKKPNDGVNFVSVRLAQEF